MKPLWKWNERSAHFHFPVWSDKTEEKGVRNGLSCWLRVCIQNLISLSTSSCTYLAGVVPDERVRTGKKMSANNVFHCKLVILGGSDVWTRSWEQLIAIPITTSYTSVSTYIPTLSSHHHHIAHPFPRLIALLRFGKDKANLLSLWVVVWKEGKKEGKVFLPCSFPFAP